MKKIIFLFLLIAPLSFAQTTTVPSPAIANSSVTINFNKTGTPLASYAGTIYAHIGLTVNGVRWTGTKGTWGNNATQPALTLTSGTTYSLALGPDLYTYFNIPTSSSITEICVVFRDDKSGGNLQSTDVFLNVGAFQSTLLAPTSTNTLLSSGGNLIVNASNTNGNASYNLLANGTSINTATTSSYFFQDSGITINKNYELIITQGTTSMSKKFSVIVNPGDTSLPMPSGLTDGINYDAADPSKATLVLNATFKDFVYVAGSFNNWMPTSSYAMKKDPATGKFWLELTGLSSGDYYTYQYWVCDQTSLPANSPSIVKTADPFSKLVLSPFDDPEIITAGVYPGLPTYPAGQEREITVLQTGPTAFYNYTWSAATTNFVKPKKKDLVIYEVLVRDFGPNRSYQDLIDKIDYFKNLKINAIQLMPIMEFEGNMSWGYNTAFHMAPDKRYGSPAKLKEFIDLCHQNGIAVILDIALNHVFGRSPLVRMWMNDANNDGWGDTVATTTENPYVNQYATHAYGVGSDLNHFREPDNLTNTYATSMIKTWIQEYKIDGFRWDLTKGFTNQCASGDETCTNGYRSDRVAKMKWYADKQWEIDPNFLVIFEHLGNGGSATEETEWANYKRSGDTGGVLLWKKRTDEYANLLKGNLADVSGIADATDRLVGYAESHDEERIAYKAFNESGQTQGNPAKVLLRLPAMGAVHLLVPGPKMIWHFGDLGWNSSLWTCNNNSVSYSNPDCKLDTKPQPQWTNNWLADASRINVYNNWAKLIDLKKSENVFENGQYAWNFALQGHPRLDIWTSTAPTSDLSYVVVLTNFSNSIYDGIEGFPFTGNWVNLMDNTPFNVNSLNMNMNIEAGGFRVYGNKAALLGTTNFDLVNDIYLYPNPASNYFTLNINTSKVAIYSITGQLVKSFDTNQSKGDQFIISEMSKGVYLVKAYDENKELKVVKLLKK